MSEWPFIIAAYAAAWIVLGGYGLYLSTRNRHAQAAVADAEREE